MEIKAYDLADAELLKDNTSGSGYLIWQPPLLCVVLGQSSDPEKSVYQDRVISDRIHLYRRPSGGEAVILSPDTLAISILSREDKFNSPMIYFNRYNEAIRRALATLGIRDLRLNGYSDISIGDKKISGSSIYRSRGRVFYHAVLNVSLSPGVIERYLRHPSREPDYRRRRPHRHFVTSLKHQGFDIPFLDLHKALSRQFGEK